MPTLENKFSTDFFDDNTDSVRAQRLRALAGQSPRDRVAALNERQADPAVCDSCGSNWFYEVEFNQYKAGTYSSAPGGELEQINAMPMRVRICACGKPYRPNIGGAFHGGRTPNEQLGSFQVSLEKSISVFERVISGETVRKTVETALNQIMGVYEQRVAALEKQLKDAGLTPAAAAPAPAVQPVPGEQQEPVSGDSSEKKK